MRVTLLESRNRVVRHQIAIDNGCHCQSSRNPGRNFVDQIIACLDEQFQIRGQQIACVFGVDREQFEKPLCNGLGALGPVDGGRGRTLGNRNDGTDLRRSDRS